MRRDYRISAIPGILSAFSAEQARRVDPQPVHARPNLGPVAVEEAVTLGFAELGPGAGSDEHADSALDQDEPVVLKSLISLGDGERIGLLFGGEGPNGRQRVAVAVLT